MKYEMTNSASENFETVKELDNGITLEHFGIKESADIGEVGEASDAVYGNPEEDSENWHKQSETMSCAVSCQEFVAEQLTGKEFNESDFLEIAEDNGWYTEQDGTRLTDVGKLLEAVGIDTEQSEHNTLNDLANALEDGDKVICSVNSKVLQNSAYADMPGIRANHAVQVIGIDASNPNKVEVILNDPGVENGKGLRVDAETFTKAWDTGDNFTVYARK